MSPRVQRSQEAHGFQAAGEKGQQAGQEDMLRVLHCTARKDEHVTRVKV